MSTTVYLDFDGVLNAISYYDPRDETGWHGQWSRKAVNGYRIVWSNELVEELRKLDERPDVTIKWLTTWTTDAVKHLAPALGIGSDWEVIGADTPAHKFEDFKVWWKKECMQVELQGPQPDKIVWIDDDLAYENSAVDVFKEFSGQWIALSPKSAIGLTRPEFETVLNFIDK